MVLIFGGDVKYWSLAIRNLLMRRAFGEKFHRSRRRGCRGRCRCFFRRLGIFFGPFRSIDMFLLHFRILAEMMFFARTAKNQRAGGSRGGGLATTKVHSAVGQ